MSRLLKSRYYLMKCLGLVLLLGFISFGVIGGCYNNGGGVSSQALTENDFANFPGLSADPEKHIIVNFLEHPDTGKPENDTGEVGNDTIPYTYTTTLNHTFCWEDDDIDAKHFMVLDDSEGNEILRIDVNGECVTELIAAGDYVMIIFHDGRIDTTHPVFIIPNRESNQQARETGGLINKFKETISRSLQNLQNKFVRDANAQTATPLQTLINTGKCIGCDLKGVDLSSIDLGHVDLTGADLSSANMRDSNFAGSNFTTANLSGANMANSNFINAVFTSAKLGGSILGDSNGLAVFSFATWTDGKCKCGVRTFTTSLVINPLGGSGREPVSIAISPDASNVYVVDKDTNSVSVIATSLNQITQVVTVGSRPTSIALSPNGLKGYVTTSFDADRIWILETDPLVLVDLVKLDVSPVSLAVSHDGSFLYIANLGSTVSVIDLSSNMVIDTISVDLSPVSVTVSPDGSKVYVANSESNTISVIGTSTNSVIDTIPVGSGPTSVALSPDGSKIYVANSNDNTVLVISTSTNTVIATIPIGSAPASVAVFPDGLFVLVANANDDTVSMIDTSTNTVIGNISVGKVPVFVAIAPSPTFPICEYPCAYVANSADGDLGNITTIAHSVGTCGGCE